MPENNRLDLFRTMLRLRMVEEAIAERYGEQEMRCPVHLSIGQEASAVGVCSQLRRDDMIVTTHRCHAHYLAKGGDLYPMLAEIYGRETGCCGGRGGSMHLMDRAVNVVASLPIVSSSIPIAVGLALAAKQKGTDQVAATFFGDGSVEEGVFHESMNFAALRKLPVLFVLENNLFAVYSRLDERQPDRPLTDLAKAHKVAAVHADGNDVDAVAEVTAEAVARARAGEGPTLLVLDTYRWREHCGPNYDNDIGYRTEDEFQKWKVRCPLAALRGTLTAEGMLTEAAEVEMATAFAAEIDAAFTAALKAPFPKSETAGDLVYA